MSRKRCKRKFYPTPAIPILFGMTQAGLNKCRLLGAAAIDAIVRGEGTDDHLAQIKQIADYCVLLCARLAKDESVEPASLPPVIEAAELAILSLANMKAHFDHSGQVHCTDTDRQRFMSLLDANDAVDSVATRRQARDVMLEMMQVLYAQVREEAARV